MSAHAGSSKSSRPLFLPGALGVAEDEKSSVSDEVIAE